MRKSVIVTILFIVFAGAVFGWLYVEGPGQQLGQGGQTEFVAFFDNVALLEPKAKVAVAGYVVGQVEQLRPAEHDVAEVTVPRIRVTFVVNNDVADRLGNDTVAAIGQESFLGAKFLDLKASLEGGPFPEVDGLPMVRTEPYSDLFTTAGELTDQIEPLIESVQDLVQNLNENVLSEANVQQISDLLVNANDLIMTAEGFLTDVQQKLSGQDGLLDDVDRLIASLERTLDQARGNLETLTNKAVETMGSADDVLATADSSLKTLTADVNERVVPSATRLMDNANDVVVGLEPRLDGTFDKLDRALVSADDLLNAKELYATLYEARRLMQELQLLVISLRADPSQLVWGGEGAEQEAEQPADRLSQRTGGRGAPYED